MFVIDNFIQQSKTNKIRQIIRTKKFQEDGIDKKRYNTLSI